MEKITKKQARNLYNQGIDVLFVPSKLNPQSPFGITVKACINQFGGEVPFSTFITHFRYYNCNKHSGLGVSYYKLDKNGR